MNASDTLCVVLPAFKPDFLGEALQSLAAQTVADFTVLVCDDCSPHPLESIAAQFQGRLRLSYHRFAENLGGRSLAAHWSRSVRRTRSQWVWLFSDDDLADPGCAEAFFAALSRNAADSAHNRVYRFDTRIVDAAGRVLRETAPYDARTSPRDYVRGRMEMRYSSFACEYIFSRAAFDAADGFVEFPAAWCSDDASWVAMAGETDIVTVPGPKVSWRRSEKNVSAPNSAMTGRKADAMIAYLEWLAERGFGGLGASEELAEKWFSRVIAEQGIRLGFRRCARAARALTPFADRPTRGIMADLVVRDAFHSVFRPFGHAKSILQRTGTSAGA